MPSLVSYSCNIGSVDRVGLGDSAQLQNAYLLFSVGLPWVTNAMQSSGQLCKAWCQKQDRRAASGIIQLSFCGGRGCLMVGKRSKRGSQMAATGGFWEGRAHAAGDARVVSRKRLHSALGSRQVLRQELEGPQKGSGSEDEK